MPLLSEIGKDPSDPGDGPDGGSESASGSGAETGALEDPQRLRELQASLGRLDDFAAQAQAENTIRSYAADLEDFRDLINDAAGIANFADLKGVSHGVPEA